MKLVWAKEKPNYQDGCEVNSTLFDLIEYCHNKPKFNYYLILYIDGQI